MKKTFLLFFVLLLFSFTAFPQSTQNDYIRCGTTEYMEYLYQQNPALREIAQNNERSIQNFIQNNPELLSGQTVVSIPVVVHVIYNTTAQNISENMIRSQIRVLNQDYRRLNTDTSSTPAAFKPFASDVKFEFYLADRDPNGNPHSGINRVQTSYTVFNYPTHNTYLKSLSYWPSDRYLNIWTCNLGNYLLGYAQFPGGPPLTDGVVILYSAFGYNSPSYPYNLGRTATHEVGHWLNLIHIWGDDNGACYGSDLCNDTPNQGPEFYGCPSYPQTTCTMSNMFMNYMDYTDDACMNIFTADQKARVYSAYTVLRPNLQVSLKEKMKVTQTGVDYIFTDLNNNNYAVVNFSNLGTADSLTVEVFPGLLPLNTPAGSKAVKRYFNITANGTGYSAAIKLYYKDSEVVGFVNGDNNLKLYKYVGSTNWALMGGTGNTTENSITLAGVTEFSRWAMSDPADNPIPVELVSFTPYVQDNDVYLNWSTATEVNSSGFEIEKAVISSNNNELEWLNIGFIKSSGTSTEIKAYSFTDKDLLPGNYNYRLKLIDNDGSFTYSSIVNASVDVPSVYTLEQNYPNPFNPATIISYMLPLKGNVSIKVFDALGNEVAVLVNEFKEAGQHNIEYNAGSLSSGVYYYTMRVNDFVQTNKMILVK